MSLAVSRQNGLKFTRQLYQFIIKKDIKVLRNIKTAEAAKVIENTQRDLNIALMNELAMIFEKIGIDVMEVIDGANTKWNFNAYYPGGGVGGHCLPVDPYYLVKKAENWVITPRLYLLGELSMIICPNMYSVYLQMH